MPELYRLDFSDGKAYIGATSGTAKARFAQHRRAASWSKKGFIYEAWRKHGEPTLTLLAILSRDDYQSTEVRAIVAFATRHPNGYNLTAGGNIAPSLEPIVAGRIALALLGRTLSAEQREKLRISSTGRKASKETRAKIGAAHRGLIPSATARAKMAAAKRGTKKGAATKERMSAAQRARRTREGCKPQRWRYP